MTTHAFAVLSSPRDILRTSGCALARSRDALRQSRVIHFVSTRIFFLSACTYRRSGSIPSRSTGIYIRIPAFCSQSRGARCRSDEDFRGSL